MTATSTSTRIKRLYYLSNHRGCKETDFILGRFAKENLHNLSDKELDLWESFLEENDWDIYAWITGKLPLPKNYKQSFIESILIP